MNYTIYDKATGRINREVYCRDDQIAQQYDASTEAALEGQYSDTVYYIDNGAAIPIPPSPGEWYDFDFVTKQWVPDSTRAASAALRKRGILLANTDWTQIPNGPLSQAKQQEWAVYRQELRDITQQPGYPFNIVWPIAPT